MNNVTRKNAIKAAIKGAAPAEVVELALKNLESNEDLRDTVQRLFGYLIQTASNEQENNNAERAEAYVQAANLLGKVDRLLSQLD